MARYMEKGETIKFPMETFSLKSSDSWLKGVGALTCEARVARHLEGGRYAYHRGDWKVQLEERIRREWRLVTAS
jgi:hypothetical protein